MEVKKQIKIWKEIATVAAFGALSLIGFSFWIGTETSYKITMIIVCSVFFTISVIWWYWALRQIGNFAGYIHSLQSVIQELKSEINSMRKEL